MNVLWRKSPLLLLRFPQLFVALAATIVVMTIAAVAGPLFLRATQTQSISEGIDQASTYLGGYNVRYDTEYFYRRGENGSEELLAFADRMKTALERRLEEYPEVGAASVTFGGFGEEALGKGGKKANVLLLHRTDAIDNITILDEANVEGVWLADRTASRLGVKAGDPIDLRSQEGEISVDVQGVYRLLSQDKEREFWAPLGPFIYREQGSFVDPLPFVLAERPVFEEALHELRTFGGLRFDFPLLETELTPERANTIAETFEKVTIELEDPSSALTEAEGAFIERVTAGNAQADTALAGIVATGVERVTTVSPVVDLLSAAARIVALATVAAAGFYMVQRRRVEALSLIGRGIGPLPQALRYTAQTLLPALVGVALGTAAGFFLVAKLGPSDSLDASALDQVWPNVIGTSLAALLVLFISAAAAVRRAEKSLEGGTGSFLPAEARRFLPIALAAALGAGVYTMRGDIRGDTAEALADPRLTLVPIALILAGGVIGAELLRFAVTALAPRLKYRSPGLYLAAKRLTGATTMPRVLIVAAACSLGIAVYGFTIASTIEATADAKARVFVGSDYAGFVGSNSVTPDIPFPITQVAQIDDIDLVGGGHVTLMGINPKTFEAATYWNDVFADEPLGDMLQRLDSGSEEPAVIVAGAEADGTIGLGSDTRSVTVKVVGNATAFPGIPPKEPLLVMDREILRETLLALGTAGSVPKEQIWVRGEPDQIQDALAKAGAVPVIQLSAGEALQTPTLTALLYVLGALGALGVAAAIVSIVTLLLFLQARHRGAMITTALVRRMGLSRRAELASWTTELIGALGASFAVAVLVGLPVSSLMAQQLDPKPSIPPQPILTTPTLMMLVLGISVLLVAATVGRLLLRSADKADVATLFRT